jgi:hypothetical protein
VCALRALRLDFSAENDGLQFILPTALVEKLALASQPITVGRARTVSNEVEIQEARLRDTIKLGNFEFRQPTITFPSLADEVNIGLKTLRDFTSPLIKKINALSSSGNCNEQGISGPSARY